MTLASYVEALARRIDSDWRADGYGQGGFAEIAAGALRALPSVGELDPQRLIAAVLEAPTLRRAGAHPSDTVVPLFEGARFTICAHVWLDELGNPHGHAWNGAFQIATGGACQALFEFDERWRHDARLRIGELRLTELAMLELGATVPVVAGGTIHGLCHLEQPSLSVVVRSWDEPDRQTLDYWRPGLALATEGGREECQPALRCLRMLRRCAPASVPALLRELLPRLDASGVVEVLRASLVAGADLDAIIALALDGPHCLRAHAEVLAGALEDMLRYSAFEQARARRRESDDRFVLGGLYLATCSDELAALARTRWGTQAEAKLLEHVAALADRSDDVLGLDPQTAAVVRTLASASDDALAKLEPARAEALQRHPMLAPLFRARPSS